MNCIPTLWAVVSQLPPANDWFPENTKKQETLHKRRTWHWRRWSVRDRITKEEVSLQARQGYLTLRRLVHTSNSGSTMWIPVSGLTTNHLTAWGLSDHMTGILPTVMVCLQALNISVLWRIAVWSPVSSLITSLLLSIPEVWQCRTASWMVEKRQDFVTLLLKNPPICRLSTTPARKRGRIY